MPFCQACDRHWTPTSMRPDGSCPDCGRVLPAVTPGADRVPTPAEEADEGVRAPWHFKVLLFGLTIYLAWRGVQGVEWLAHRL
ncbi:MAG: hypothetical protein ABIS47_14365 [Acidimicrobiales bacterium]